MSIVSPVLKPKVPEGGSYAKLEGQDIEYFINELKVTLGRKSKSAENVDYFIGSEKSISRQHAEIYYNFDKKMFELRCLGTNGVRVDGNMYKPDQNPIAELRSQSLIQIGSKCFYFLLPVIVPSSKRKQDGSNTAGGPNAKVARTTLANEEGANTNVGFRPRPSQGQEPVSNADTLQGNISTASSLDLIQRALNPQNYLKPNMSYGEMIKSILITAPGYELPLKSIYFQIMERYPFYRDVEPKQRWMRSVRQNLSKLPCFTKSRREGLQGRQMSIWKIADAFLGQDAPVIEDVPEGDDILNDDDDDDAEEVRPSTTSQGVSFQPLSAPTKDLTN